MFCLFFVEKTKEAQFCTAYTCTCTQTHTCTHTLQLALSYLTSKIIVLWMLPCRPDWELGTVFSESPIKGQAVNFVEIKWVPRKARGSCLSQFALSISLGPPPPSKFLLAPRFSEL